MKNLPEEKKESICSVFFILIFFYQNINAVTKVLKRTVTEEVDQASVQLMERQLWTHILPFLMFSSYQAVQTYSTLQC